MVWPGKSDRIALGNDGVARVNVLSQQEAIVSGLAAGRTTVTVWLTTGRRLLYALVVEPNLETARAALRGLNPSLALDLGADGVSAILRGDVANETEARQAYAVVDLLMPRIGDGRQSITLVNLLRQGGSFGTSDERLMAAMRALDSRIRVRPIQQGATPDPTRDSYILEGRVRDVNTLVQAVILAERQLGGTGSTVRAADAERVGFERTGSVGIGSMGGAGGLQALQGSAPPRSGISAQVARGLVLTSESGRVVSFLEVDSLPQVNVAIRALEIDRSRARRLGVNIRFDNENLTIGSFNIPGTALLRDVALGSSGVVASGTNLVASYVSGTTSIMAAFDFLSERRLARSVAEPNVLTLSGEVASVLVGGEVPIPVSVATQVAVESGFAFQQFGVRMDIRPTVNADGNVALEVAPSIVSPTADLGTRGVPGFRVQRVETTAMVQAGESLVLGGLLTSSDSQQRRGVPLLDSVPILRPFFSWERTVSENSELVFVITPRVVQPPSVDVRLPPLEFEYSPNRRGASGLDANGVPITFRSRVATVVGDNTACAEVREEARDDARVVECVRRGTMVHVLRSDAGWQQVRTPSGAEGWIPTPRLQLTKER
jgi:pilus assembly protein CpaC